MDIVEIQTKNALKIRWSATEEFIPFNFDDLEANKGIIISLEHWYEEKPPRWVKYLATIECSRTEAVFTFKLTYKKTDQSDSFARKYATWGITTIIFDRSVNVWSARWDDDSDASNDGNAEIEVSTMPTPSQSSQLTHTVSSSPKNAISLSKFLSSLGCTLRLGFYWSAASDDNKRIIFTIWDDQIEDGRYLLLPHDDADWGSLPGAYEVRRHLPFAKLNDVEVFGVLCHAKDQIARTRKRAYYDDQSLLTLKIVEEGNAVFAIVKGEIEVSRARKERILDQGAPRADAISDLDTVPPGIENPERVISTTSSFSRDRMVRDFVLKRAKGHCEYCGAPGFEMPGDRRYLEAHHIVALSSLGPDTIENVIALCPTHHREAHYGIRREAMNVEMLSKLNRVYKN